MEGTGISGVRDVLLTPHGSTQSASTHRSSTPVGTCPARKGPAPPGRGSCVLPDPGGPRVLRSPFKQFPDSLSGCPPCPPLPVPVPGVWDGPTPGHGYTGQFRPNPTPPPGSQTTPSSPAPFPVYIPPRRTRPYARRGGEGALCLRLPSDPRDSYLPLRSVGAETTHGYRGGGLNSPCVGRVQGSGYWRRSTHVDPGTGLLWVVVPPHLGPGPTKE